ncbi:MAG: hypothetical protein C4530_11990 [Desulfobacteraceae bacterium]|nr:MAG: hypothetical protein C4530_11990 [Desulfobacteraceae bacterium]
MKRWRLFAGIGIVFVLGVLAGVLGAGIYVKYKMLPLKLEPKARKVYLLDRFTRRLDLTEAQRAGFKEIFDEMDKVREQYRSEMRKTWERAIPRMKQELNPEQQKKLDELRRDWETRRRKKE